MRIIANQNQWKMKSHKAIAVPFLTVREWICDHIKIIIIGKTYIFKVTSIQNLKKKLQIYLIYTIIV